MMKNYNGPRSKFSLLPHQIRWRAYNLLQDGATLKALTADPEIKDALERAGTTLSSANLAGIRKGKEYADFCAMRRKHLEAKQKDMMLTAIAQGTGTLESMTDQARVRLMEALSDLSGLLATAKQGEDGSDESRIKALRSLAQSVAALTNPAKDNQIAELKRKLRENEAQQQAAETEWKNREAELLARIAELEGSRKAASGMSKETLEEVEGKIKLL